MDKLLLVNKSYGIDEGYVPNDLVVCDNNENNFHHFLNPNLKPMIRKEVYEYFTKLRTEALKCGFDIIIDSGFRSSDYQKDIWCDHYFKEYLKLKKECPSMSDMLVNALATNNTDLLVARPGHSEHQTGFAIDIGCFREGQYSDEITNSDEFYWMDENAHKYGFILRYPLGKEDITGYSYEPWHYRYIGVNDALNCYLNNYTLEEYHQKVLKK